MAPHVTMSTRLCFVSRPSDLLSCVRAWESRDTRNNARCRKCPRPERKQLIAGWPCQSQVPRRASEPSMWEWKGWAGQLPSLESAGQSWAGKLQQGQSKGEGLRARRLQVRMDPKPCSLLRTNIKGVMVQTALWIRSLLLWAWADLPSTALGPCFLHTEHYSHTWQKSRPWGHLRMLLKFLGTPKLGAYVAGENGVPLGEGLVSFTK